MCSPAHVLAVPARECPRTHPLRSTWSRDRAHAGRTRALALGRTRDLTQPHHCPHAHPVAWRDRSGAASSHAQSRVRRTHATWPRALRTRSASLAAGAQCVRPRRGRRKAMSLHLVPSTDARRSRSPGTRARVQRVRGCPSVRAARPRARACRTRSCSCPPPARRE